MSKLAPIAVARLYAKGISTRAIGERFGVPATAVRFCLKRSGVVMRPPHGRKGVTPRRHGILKAAEVARLYGELGTVKAVAARLGCSLSPVYRVLIAAGLRPRRRYVPGGVVVPAWVPVDLVQGYCEFACEIAAAKWARRELAQRRAAA